MQRRSHLLVRSYETKIMSLPGLIRIYNTKTPEVIYNAAGLVACRPVLLKDAVVIREAVKRLRSFTYVVCLMLVCLIQRFATLPD